MAVAPSGSAPIVTALPVAPGQRVAEGTLVLAVAGRPVVALALPVPLYRDLVPGLQGPDVRAVQDVLARLGHRVPPAEAGRFGPATQAAVAAVWRATGYEPLDTGPAQAAALAAAEAAVEAAAAAWQTAPPEEVQAAEQAYDAAVAARAAERARTGVVVPRTEVAAVAALPAVVTHVAVPLGGSVPDGAPAVRLAGAGLVVRAEVEPAQARQLAAGMTGRVFGHDGAQLAEVSVASVDGPAAVADGDEGSGLPTVVLTTAPELPDELVGADLRVEIDTTPRTAVPVLAMPVVAVRDDGAGTYVLVARGGDRQERVTVEPGTAAGGWVEIRGDRPGLEAGDRVVVG